ncbi:MAG: hypothetical protein Q9166_006874 [cf. Caloplaca sp. 2 TL-2023]
MYPEAEEKTSDHSTNSRNGLNDETAPLTIDDDPVYSYDVGSMTHSLNLDSTIVLVFVPTYVIFQPPSILLARKLGPRRFLAALTLLWGVAEIVGVIFPPRAANCLTGSDSIQGFGFVKKWTDIIGLRVVLGAFESGLFTSVVYLMATWYSRYDVGKRYCAFYVIGCLALVFGGILAYGLMQMNGLSGKEGWRWIFIMEGTITCVTSFFACFFLVDFPEKADQSWRFLNKDERDFIVRRINKDRDDAIPEKFTMARFLKPGLDIKLWILALIFFSIQYCLAAIFIIASAYLGDRFHVRGPILIANSLVALIGLPLMGFAHQNGARYFGVFLVTAGTNANVPTALAYQANNVRGQWKRALCSAMFVAIGGIGAISGGTIFRSQDAPRYVPGIAAAITCHCLVIVVVLGLSGYYMWANRQADKGEKVLEGSEAFRYTI